MLWCSVSSLVFRKVYPSSSAFTVSGGRWDKRLAMAELIELGNGLISLLEGRGLGIGVGAVPYQKFPLIDTPAALPVLFCSPTQAKPSAKQPLTLELSPNGASGKLPPTSRESQLRAPTHIQSSVFCSLRSMRLQGLPSFTTARLALSLSFSLSLSLPLSLPLSTALPEASSRGLPPSCSLVPIPSTVGRGAFLRGLCRVLKHHEKGQCTRASRATLRQLDAGIPNLPLP